MFVENINAKRGVKEYKIKIKNIEKYKNSYTELSLVYIFIVTVDFIIIYERVQ